jgi:hypothetical protein
MRWLMIVRGLVLAVLLMLGGSVAAGDGLSDARATVDSTCSGYGTDVLTDGKWVEIGKEITQVYGHRDALGNSGNSWVSATTADVEHWVRLDWPQAVTLNQLSVWWTLPAWWPQAVRAEMLSDTNWVSLTGPGDWLRPTAQHSVIIFPPVTTRTIRLLQHPQGGEADRGFLTLQEIAAQLQPEAEPGLEGARRLTAEELKALEPVKLERNIARLHETQPGASCGWIFGRTIEETTRTTALVDGKLESIPQRLPAEGAPGVHWPVAHVLDGAAVFFADAVPTGAVTVRIRGADDNWLPVTTRLTVWRDRERRCIVADFEPVATRAIAVELPPGSPMPVEMEAYRYLPTAPNVWPERLVNGQFEREWLASGEEPSFAGLATAALSMTPAHALLGLKDDKREVGVTWDGDIISSLPLRLSFGPKQERLADVRDNLGRDLRQGWRPETRVAAQLPNHVVVMEDVFVTTLDLPESQPVIVARLSLANVGPTPVATSLNVTIDPHGKALIRQGSCIMAGEAIALALDPSQSVTLDGNMVTIPVTLSATKTGRTAEVTLLQPLTPVKPEQIKWPLALRSLREGFESYWDKTLRPAAAIDVPEERINDLYKAVLTQLFINADGDVMPYGSFPSVYDGNLYGVEEGYAMMALAQSGFSADAERYMDHTYLTPDFLVKVPEYKKYADRHQQYRNGLQPSYAIRLYKLTRNRAWIEKHLPLFTECAEWTIAQRRTTMVEENGVKPLHWGLLPKWSYGGDISELQCYALYANFCCWKGLMDTAWLLDDLGDKATAERYRQEAADYRACVDRAVEGNVLRDQTPPFLPLQLYAKAPVGNDYDQLFIGCLLDLMALEPGGQQMRYLTDWMEQDNRTFCLLPRFRRDVGPGGLDGLYGLGYIQSKLQQDKVNEFLLGFYAYLAFNMDHATFASRETNLIYASDLHVRSRYKVPDMSDPIPCSSAVAVLLLRDMLVMEAPTTWGEANTELRLLHGTPQAWFEQGKSIRFENLPTEFGPVSVKVDAGKSALTATVRPPTRNPWRRLVVRVRHPEGKHWERVLVNGKPHADVDAQRELIALKPGPSSFKIKVEY